MPPSGPARCRGASQDGDTGNPGLTGGKNTGPRPKSQQSGPEQRAEEPPRTGIPGIRAWQGAKTPGQDQNHSNPGLAGGKNTGPRPKSQQSGLEQRAGKHPRTETPGIRAWQGAKTPGHDQNHSNPGLSSVPGSLPGREYRESGPGKGQKHRAKTKITAIRA
jgi:hypothetical protein